ncbi:MAG: hypothetical protein Q9174_001721 [Haloplaca sp. 1 TL-2023]
MRLLTACSILQFNVIPRLADQFSSLMISDRQTTIDTPWTPLESLPPEVLACITSNLAFFDKKALASTSHRLYDLMPPLHPPDRFAWRVHLCAASNRAPDAYFDMSILNAPEFREEVKRLVVLNQNTLTRGHYVLDPRTTRLKDLGCLYFPTGFQTSCGGRQIWCRSMGQFIAIQFEEYAARIIQLSRKKRKALALNTQPPIPASSLNQAQEEARSMEVTHWKAVRDAWVARNNPPGGMPCTISCPFCSLGVMSAWDFAKKFLSKMGIDVLEGRVCMYGRICEVGNDQKTEVRVPVSSSDERFLGLDFLRPAITSEGTEHARDRSQPLDELEIDEADFDEAYDADVPDSPPEYDADVEAN